MAWYKIIVTLLVVNLVITESRLIAPPGSLHQNLFNKQEKTLTDYQKSLRLPDSIRPKNYKIVLTPYLDNEFGEKFTFDGLVEITFEIKKEAYGIILHSEDLELNYLYLIRPDKNQLIETITKNDAFLKDVIYIKPTILSNFTIGNYILIISYKGTLDTDVMGFYRTSYQNKEGETIWLATTQFQPIGARRAFPCFDEPELKATFDLTIRHRMNYSAISNMPVKISIPVGSFKETIFDTTPIMSTYLLAFVISDFQILRAKETFSVYARSDVVNDGKLALEVGQQILNFMEVYTGIPYAFPKLDQVAIPGRDGAMENWGLILYREGALLYNSQNKDGGKQTFEIIAHEMAHQWFGNLVTPKWWKFIWLSEGFARYFENYISDQIKPEWKSMQLFVIRDIPEMTYIYDRNEVFAFPLENNVRTATEIKEMFGHISYIKGSAIVRMIHHLLGNDVFKRGLNIYLTKNKYKSVQSTDLFRALDEAAEEYELNLENKLENLMASWMNCKGYPIVTVTRHYKKPNLITFELQMLEVFGFDYDEEIEENEDDCNWYVPINYVTAKRPEFHNTSLEFWLQNPSENVSIEVEPNDWVIINKQQTGLYRVNYDNKNWNLIVNHLNSEKFFEIHVLNRAQLLDDAFTFYKKGNLEIQTLLYLCSYLRRETDYIAIYPGIKIISGLHERLKNTQYYSFFKKNILEMAHNILKATGFEELPEDIYVDKQKRNIAIHWACLFEDRICTNYMMNQLEKELNKPMSDLLDFDEIKLCDGLRKAPLSLWKKVFDKYLIEEDDIKQQSLESGLGCTSNTLTLQFILDYTDKNSSLLAHLFRITESIQRNSNIGLDSILKHLSKIFKDSKSNEYIDESYRLFLALGETIKTKTQLDKLKALKRTKRLDSLIERAVYVADKNIKWLADNENALIAWKQGGQVDFN